MRDHLGAISIGGFKSIRRLDHFQPQSLNVLIGANGAGKSNFLEFFRMLRRMLTPPGELQGYIREHGGAGRVLFNDGRAKPVMNAGIAVETDDGVEEYAFELVTTAADSVAFGSEEYQWTASHRKSHTVLLPASVWESSLMEIPYHGTQKEHPTIRLARQCIVHSVRDGARAGRLGQRWPVSDAVKLKEDAANLAPFLLRLRETARESYRRVVEAIRTIFPPFADFELHADSGYVLLQWREQNNDAFFVCEQGSDGLLRFMRLATILLQPAAMLPDVLLIDEPELGLHPHALELLAGLIQRASAEVQVVIATQSPALVSEFEPQDIVVVDRDENGSRFRRLGAEELGDWLNDYTLGELWQKNYLEGAGNG